MATTIHVTLYRFALSADGFDISSWVNRLEYLLLFSHVPYTVESSDILSAPRGRMPYIKLKTTTNHRGKNGRYSAKTTTEEIPDSWHAYNTLVKRGHIVDLDAGITLEQRAKGRVIEALVLEMYWLGVKER